MTRFSQVAPGQSIAVAGYWGGDFSPSRLIAQDGGKEGVKPIFYAFLRKK
jgi:hypothetical protein